MLEISDVRVRGTWRDVADSARTTVGLEAGTGDPANTWKKRMLLAEHSPIRQLEFKWKWLNLPFWVSVHLVRHWLGILHWISTSRSDRIGKDRNKLPQDNPIIHECAANAQALINVSRKRLCSKASPETREAWKMAIDALNEVDPIVASVCVPECIYRGFCPEFRGCGYIDSHEAQDRLNEYRRTK